MEGAGCASRGKGATAGYTTSRSYDASGFMVSTTDGGGQATQQAYDAAGNLASVTEQESSCTNFRISGHPRYRGLSYRGLSLTPREPAC
jgi:YD repeat-containing protein